MFGASFLFKTQRKSPNIKSFGGGGGVLGLPKFFMPKLFVCFICALWLLPLVKHVFQGEILNAPPPPPIIWAGVIFTGGGGVYFEDPCGRNSTRPPSFIRPPPLEGYFQGGGGGV